MTVAGRSSGWPTVSRSLTDSRVACPRRPRHFRLRHAGLRLTTVPRTDRAGSCPVRLAGLARPAGLAPRWLVLRALGVLASFALAGDEPVRHPLRIDRRRADVRRVVLQGLDPRADVRRSGLAISKGLVEAHGGRIRAESPGAGRGTTVTFTVPVAGEAPRILVVDDDPRMLRFVRDALSDAGYAPLVTGAPQDLPGIIRTERPRLVLLDLILPEADGIELMRQVPELADLPVIFISAYGRDETVATRARVGRGRLPRQALLADPSWSPGSGRRSGDARSPSRSRSESSPSTTGCGG